ncbi:MAG: hypothetical protein ABFC78_03790 [Methanoregula sp.]
MYRIFSILLTSILLISGCSAPSNENNNLKQTVSNDCVSLNFPDIKDAHYKIGSNETASNISQSIDYKNSIVKDYAFSHIFESDRENYRIEHVLDIWDNINARWCYMPLLDEYANYTTASEIIKRQNFAGNCLNFATVTSASIEAIGGKSRIIKSMMPYENQTWHSYAEVFVGNSSSDAQSVVELVKKRYSTENVYLHIENDSQGSMNYWLPLDFIPKRPGGPRFDDNGEYWVYYPDGSFILKTDSGYAENFPSAKSATIDFKDSKKISNSMSYYYPIDIHQNETIIIDIEVDESSVNPVILDQENFKIINSNWQNGTNQSYSQKFWFGNVEHRSFSISAPYEGLYYLIIFNDSKIPKDVYVTTTIWRA